MIVHYYLLCFLAAIFGSVASFSSLPESESGTESYTFENTVRLNGVNVTRPEANDVAFKIGGQVAVSRVWQNADDPLEKLYHVRISYLKISVKKDRNDSSDFVEQPIKLDTAKNDAFLIHWSNYRVERIYLNPDETTSMRNLKKAIANTFQYRDTHAHAEEMNVCGMCSVTYEIIDKHTILKHQKNCVSHLPIYQHPEKIFGAERRIERRIKYQLNDDSKVIKITSYETVEFSLSIKKSEGFFIVATLDLNYRGTDARSISMLPGNSAEEAVNTYTNKFNAELESDTLFVTEEPLIKEENSLIKILKENREYLKEKNLGTYQSAVAFLNILKVVQESSESEIIKALKNKKNEPILNQFMDILGSAQTLEAHNAVMKTFNFVQPYNIDPLERYLWSISIGRKPKVEFVQDLQSIIKKKPKNEKLKETLILTLTALARKFSQDVSLETYKVVIDGLSACLASDENCIACYLRAFKNLKNPKAKPIILKYAQTGSRMLSVTALKVLYSFPSSNWDEEVLKVADKIYYQKDKIYDSSARTIAVDIIIDSNPSRETLRHLLKSVQTNNSFEVRKYVLQRLQQTASTNKSFNENLRFLMKEGNLIHYDFLAQKGLSNALTKVIFRDSDLRASLFTINEVSKSVLKRSHVSVSLGQENSTMKVYAIDLFTSGLSSFLWSDGTSSEDELEEAEDLTAGMELTIYGVAIRPFVFFNGHMELMSHIMSATASERTSILQAMGLLQEHSEQITLITGNIIKFDLVGSSSFELAGKVQFSLWNRNAHTHLDSKVGAVINGLASVDAFSIKNGINFRIYFEQKVDVIADLDFYEEVLLCLQISQLKTTAKCDVSKHQNIPNSKYSTYRKKQKKLTLPGRTFALNQRNNDMCNKIFRHAG